MNKENQPILILGGLFLLWLLLRRYPLLAPAGSPAFGTFTRGGSSVSVPGVGAYSTGPGGTSIVLDPRLFGAPGGATSGASAFNPGSGVLTPLAPFPPNPQQAAIAGAAIGADGLQPVDPAKDPTGTMPDGSTIVTPDWTLPPETPTQIPLTDPGADPSLLDPNLFQVPAISLDPAVLDTGFAASAAAGDLLAF